jgi:hypothetical protein
MEKIKSDLEEVVFTLNQIKAVLNNRSPEEPKVKYAISGLVRAVDALKEVIYEEKQYAERVKPVWLGIWKF